MKKEIDTIDISAQLDSMFGVPGSRSRNEAERKAWQEYKKQKLQNALKRKQP